MKYISLIILLCSFFFVSCEYTLEEVIDPSNPVPIEVVQAVAGYMNTPSCKTLVDSVVVFKYTFANKEPLDIKIKVENLTDELGGIISYNGSEVKLDTPFRAVIQEASEIELKFKTSKSGSYKLKVSMSSDNFKNSKEFSNNVDTYNSIFLVDSSTNTFKLGELSYAKVSLFNQISTQEKPMTTNVKCEFVGGAGQLMLDTISSSNISFVPQEEPIYIEADSKNGFCVYAVSDDELVDSLLITIMDHNGAEENHTVEFTPLLPDSSYLAITEIAGVDGGIHDLGKTKPFSVYYSTTKLNTYTLDVEGFGVTSQRLSGNGRDTVHLSFPSYGTHNIGFVLTDKFGVTSKKSIQYKVWESFKHKLEFDQPITDYNSSVFGYLNTMGTTVDADLFKCAYKSDVPMTMMCYGKLIEPMQLRNAGGAKGLPVSFTVKGEGHNLKAANSFKMSLHIVSRHTDMWYEYEVNIPAHHLSLEVPKTISSIYNSNVCMPTSIPFKLNSSRRSPNMTIKVDYDQSKGSIIYQGIYGMTTLESGREIVHDINVSFMRFSPNKIGKSDISITIADSNGFCTSGSTTVDVINQDVILEVDTLAERRYFNNDRVKVPLVLRSSTATEREILFNTTNEGYLLYKGVKIVNGQSFTVASVPHYEAPPLLEFVVKGYADYTISFEMEDEGNKTLKIDRDFFVPCYLRFSAEGPGSVAIDSEVSNLESLYNVGDVETIMSLPSKDGRFIGWFENGVKISDEKNITITINTDRDVMGKFEYL